MGDYLFFKDAVRYREVAKEIPKRDFYRHFSQITGDVYLRKDLAADPHKVALALFKRYPNGVLRGFAALSCRGYDLPEENWRPIISIPSAASAASAQSGKGVILRRKTPAEVQIISGRTLVTDIQAIVDIVSMPETYGNAQRSFEDHVALLDFLLRQNPEIWQGIKAHKKLHELAGYTSIFAESPPESVLRVRLKKAGMGDFVPQFRVEIEGKVLYLDLADPHSFVAVEYHGGWHYSAQQRAVDSTRKNLLQQAGWEVLEVSSGVLNDKKAFANLCQQIRNIRQKRLRQRKQRLPITKPLNEPES